MRKHSVTGIILIIILIIASCKKQNEETLINNQGGPAACDTVNMKYSINVLPIIKSNCYSCHGNGLVNGGVNLDGYSNIKVQVDNNNLINAITHAPGFTPMPEGLPQLSTCDINIIKDWISTGAPNN